MPKPPDEADRARAGALPNDPSSDAEPMDDGPDESPPPHEDGDAPGGSYNPDADVRGEGEAHAGGEAAAPKVDPALAGLAARWRTVAEWGADWLATPPPARDWLLRDSRKSDRYLSGALPLGRVGMLAGEGGAGKTWALVQLAVAVAAAPEGGKDTLRWLNTFEVAHPGRVALLCGEEERDELRRRLWHACELAELDSGARTRLAARLVAVPLPGLNPALLGGGRGTGGMSKESPWEPSPFAMDLQARLAAGGPWSLLVMDPLARFAGADGEADNAAATRLIEVAELLTTTPGTPTVLLAHHTNKASRKADGDAEAATAARGASALVDGSRWYAALTHYGADEDAGCKLAFPKSSYTAPIPPVVLTRDREHGGALRLATKIEAGEYAEAEEAKKPKSRTAGKGAGASGSPSGPGTGGSGSRGGRGSSSEPDEDS